MAQPSKKVILVILDGWGLHDDPNVSAIHWAKTPFYDELLRTKPHSQLLASEEAVGLPHGQMGNSEIGHFSIGAGRVELTELERINHAIFTGAISQNQVFRGMVNYCKTEKKPLHLIGLVSDGGVHSALSHIQGLLSLLAEEHLPCGVFIHGFTDGRDTDPLSGKKFFRILESHAGKVGCGRVASIIGRFYAMDRDKRWERTQKAYELLVHGSGAKYPFVSAAIEDSYIRHITDEFIEPVAISEAGVPIGRIQPGDAVFSFNFRTDRMRQLSFALTQQAMPAYNLVPIPDLYYVTMTNYDENFKNVRVMFDKSVLKNTLGEVLSKAGKKQIRIAETEKYPHVTFFFNGGREKPMDGEDRILCPSPKVQTYDLKPEMSAYDIRDAIVPRLREGVADFVCLNFANADMVGHTGDFQAAVKACEAVDNCLRDVITTAQAHGYIALIIADHGNADRMVNPDGTPNTAHTLAPVPCILVEPEQSNRTVQNGRLADVAPTILTLLELPIPAEMTGNVLVQSSVPVLT